MSKKWLVSVMGNSLLIGVSILSVCVFSEALVRVLYSPPPKAMSFFRLTSSEYYYPHQEVGWLPRSNVYGKHDQAGSFSTTFRTNSRGLRDREYSLDKPEGRSRIVVIGDSFTWGWGVNDEAIFTEVLESTLENVDVINLGVTAFNVKQEFEYLKLEGMLYHPDIVVLAICMNDFESVSVPTPGSQSGSNTSPVQKSSFDRAKQLASDYSVLYGFVVGRVNTSKPLVKFLTRVGLKGELAGYEELDTNLKPALKKYPERLELNWEQLTALLLQIHEYLQQNNVRLFLAPVPSLQAVDAQAFTASIAYSLYDPDDFDLDKPYRALEKFAREHQIHIVNSLRTFREQHTPRTRLFLNGDMHFNELGHKVFARTVADTLKGSLVSPFQQTFLRQEKQSCSLCVSIDE